MGEREARIAELTDEVEQLTSQLTEQQETVEQLQSDKAALEAELQQRDEDLSQVAPPSLVVVVVSLHTCCEEAVSKAALGKLLTDRLECICC